MAEALSNWDETQIAAELDALVERGRLVKLRTVPPAYVRSDEAAYYELS